MDDNNNFLLPKVVKTFVYHATHNDISTFNYFIVFELKIIMENMKKNRIWCFKYLLMIFVLLKYSS